MLLLLHLNLSRADGTAALTLSGATIAAQGLSTVDPVTSTGALVLSMAILNAEGQAILSNRRKFDMVSKLVRRLVTNLHEPLSVENE